MPEYDPNLPQEFAHMPKRRGLGPVMLLLAIVTAFVLAALFGTLRHQAPTTSAPASSQAGTAAETGTPAPASDPEPALAP